MDDGERTERTGVLVVSVHHSGVGGGLVATFTAIPALDAERAVIIVPGDLETILDRVRDWYAAVAGGAPLDWVTDR